MKFLKNSSVKNPAVLAQSESQKGASMVEYALLVALIALIAIAAVRGVGTQLSSTFSGISSDLNTAN